MEKKIEIGFDGACKLCNHSVKWLRKHDRNHRLSYKTLPTEAPSVTLSDEAGEWEASTAVLRAMGHLGGRWFILSRIVLIIPKAIRDAIYRTIAQNRHRFFSDSGGDQNNVG